MITQTLINLSKKHGLTIPLDFTDFLAKYDFNDSGAYEITAKNKCFIFSGFLGESEDPDMNLVDCYNDYASGTDFLIFGFGVYGECFFIKVKGDNIGQVVVAYSDEGEDGTVIVAKSFTEFINRLVKIND